MKRTRSLLISKGINVLLLLALIFSALAAYSVDPKYLVSVGTYTGKGSQGIYAYRFDPASGKVTTLGLAAKTENPSFLAADPNGRFRYAANELGNFYGQPTGAVSAFEINRENGRCCVRLCPNSPHGKICMAHEVVVPAAANGVGFRGFGASAQPVVRSPEGATSESEL